MGMRKWKDGIHDSHHAKNLICDQVCSAQHSGDQHSKK